MESPGLEEVLPAEKEELSPAIWDWFSFGKRACFFFIILFFL